MKEDHGCPIEAATGSNILPDEVREGRSKPFLRPLRVEAGSGGLGEFRRSIAEFYMVHREELVLVACRIVGERVDADDIVHQVFYRMLSRPPGSAVNYQYFRSATALGISVHALKKRLTRGRNRLRDILLKQGFNETSDDG
jgi:DNA-directed RNA polymerase specialized sigma24 family protein